MTDLVLGGSDPPPRMTDLLLGGSDPPPGNSDVPIPPPPPSCDLCPPQVVLLVLEVVDTVVSSSAIRDFHKNSFWQHHCGGMRKLYTNSGVHTVRSQKLHIQATQMDSSLN